MEQGPSLISSAEGQQVGVDAARLRMSMDRLFDICKSIAEKADEVVLTRCPYKNAAACCTAGFGCRNQLFTPDRSTRPICTGSDKLDYRRAWEL